MPTSKTIQSPVFFTLIIVKLIFLLGLFSTVSPICVDDFFRVFHAAWWWDHKSFTSSHQWLPGYSYIYGTIIGLFQDTVLAPKLLTTLLHLGTGLLVFFWTPLFVDKRNDASVKRSGKVNNINSKQQYLESLDFTNGPANTDHHFFHLKCAALIWLFFSPINQVLSVVPLTESLFGFLLVSAVLALGHFLKKGTVLSVFISALFYMAAASVRYEGWIFLPIFSTTVFFSHVGKKMHNALRLTLAILPWIIPFTWIIYLWINTGEWSSFLSIIKEDHFGPAPFTGLFQTSLGIATGVQFLIAIVLLTICVLQTRKKRDSITTLLWEGHGILGALFVLLALVTQNIPSQFGIRLLFPTILLAAIPFAKLAKNALNTRFSRLITLLATLFVAGTGAFGAVAAKTQIDPSSVQTALFVNQAFKQGHLDQNAHILVEKDLPDSAALVVYGNKQGQIHIDGLEGPCKEKALQPGPPSCTPPWLNKVILVIVRPNGPGELSVQNPHWQKLTQIKHWVVYKKKQQSR